MQRPLNNDCEIKNNENNQYILQTIVNTTNDYYILLNFLKIIIFLFILFSIFGHMTLIVLIFIVIYAIYAVMCNFL